MTRATQDVLDFPVATEIVVLSLWAVVWDSFFVYPKHSDDVFSNLYYEADDSDLSCFTMGFLEKKSDTIR